MGGNITKKKSFKNCFEWRVKSTSQEIYRKDSTEILKKNNNHVVLDKKPCEVEVDYKIYDSYGCSECVILRQSKSINPNIKVLRRSLDGMCLRNSQMVADSLQTGDDTLLRRRSQEGLNDRRSSINDTCYHSSLRRSRRSPSLIRYPVKRCSSSLSINSIGYRVDLRDLPNSQKIKRKCRQFEINFVRSFTSHHQLSATQDLFQLLAVGISKKDGEEFITLENCLSLKNDGRSLNDIKMFSDTLKSIVPLKHTQILMDLLQCNTVDICRWSSYAREVFTSLTLTASKELSRIYEYQISLMGDGAPMLTLAKYSSECSMDHIYSKNLLLNVNSIVEGVTRGKSLTSNLTVSVLIGEKELKWKLYEIFRRPGLKKELLLFQVYVPEHRPPWECLVSDESDPMLYGYRTVMLEREFTKEVYQLHNDESKFNKLFPWNPEDFHRNFLPRRRLIGDEVIESLKRLNSNSTFQTTLNDHVINLTGRRYVADEIEVMLRSFKRKQDLFADPRPSTLRRQSMLSDKNISVRINDKPTIVNEMLPEIVYKDSPSPNLKIKRRPSTKAVIKFALTPTHCPTTSTTEANERILTSQQLNMVELKDLMNDDKQNTSQDGSVTLSADESSSDISDSRDSFGSGNQDMKSSHDYSLATSCNSNNAQIFGNISKSLDESCSTQQENKRNPNTRSSTLSDVPKSDVS